MRRPDDEVVFLVFFGIPCLGKSHFIYMLADIADYERVNV